MDGTSTDVCKEQRRLKEEQRLGIGSGESKASDVDTLVMDIDDDDDIFGNRLKPSGVGTENFISLNTNSSGSPSIPNPQGWALRTLLSPTPFPVAPASIPNPQGWALWYKPLPPSPPTRWALARLALVVSLQLHLPTVTAQDPKGWALRLQQSRKTATQNPQGCVLTNCLLNLTTRMVLANLPKPIQGWAPQLQVPPQWLRQGMGPTWQ